MYKLVMLLVLFIVTFSALSAQSSAPVITPQNAVRLSEHAVIGRGMVNDLAYSPDGTLLALATSRGVWLYDVADWEAEPRLLTVPRLLGEMQHIAFSPDGRTISAVSSLEFPESADNTAHTWDIQTGDLLMTYGGGIIRPTQIAYSPDGDMLLVAVGDMLDIFDIQTGATLSSRRVTTSNAIRTLTYSPDGAYLLTTYDDGILHISPAPQPANAYTLEPRIIIQKSSGAIARNEAVYHPQGHIVAMLTDTGIDLYDVATGEALASISSSIELSALAYSADGDWLITGARTGDVHRWSMTGSSFTAHITQHASQVNNIAVHPNGVHIATSNSTHLGRIIISDMQSDETHHILDNFNHINSDFDIHPHNQTVIGSGSSGLELWDMETGAPIATLPIGNRVRNTPNRFYYSLVRYSPDGRWLAVFSYDAQVRMLDADTFEVVHTVPLASSRQIRMLFHPQEDVLVTLERETITFWDVTTGDALHTIRAEESPQPNNGFRAMVYSADGSTFAYMTYPQRDTNNQSVVVLSTQTYAPIVEWMGDTWMRGFLLVALPAHGIVVSHYEQETGTLSLWDIDTQTRISEITLNLPDLDTPPSSFPDIIAYSPDGQLLATAYCNELQVWDANTGDLLARLDGHNNYILSIRFSADGRAIATSAEDFTIRLWRVRE